MFDEDDEIINIYFINVPAGTLYWCQCNVSLVHLNTNHCFNKQDISPQIFDITFR